MNKSETNMRKLIRSFFKSANFDNVEKLKELIPPGKNINDQDMIGANNTTLLMSAFQYGCVHIPKFLIESGADLEAVDTSGRTMFHFAVIGNNLANVQMLIDSGVNIEKSEYSDINITPLHYAAQKDNLEIVRALIKAGFNVNAANKWGGTPLQHVAYSGNIEIIKLLIYAGVNIDAINDHGQTALTLAAWQGKIAAMKVLLNAGSNLFLIDNSQKSVLEILKQENPLKYEQYKDDLIKLYQKIKLKRLKKEDSKHTTLTDYDFNI